MAGGRGNAVRKRRSVGKTVQIEGGLVGENEQGGAVADGEHIVREGVREYLKAAAENYNKDDGLG